MFYLIGLGLGDEKDISVKALEALQTCELVFLESYTSIFAHLHFKAEPAEDKVELDEDDNARSVVDSPLPFDQRPEVQAVLQRMQQLYCPHTSIRIAERWLVEAASTEPETHPNSNPNSGNPNVLPLALARTTNVALLVVGDPLSATTHTDLLLRCKAADIPYTVIHNASILTAVGVTGLSLYRFGPTLSIPFFSETWKPTSFYDKLRLATDSAGRLQHHTLCLLDIKVKEPTLAEMAVDRAPRHFVPPRFMTVNQAIQQLLLCEDLCHLGILRPDTPVIACARLGASDARICFGSMALLRDLDFGPPLHSLIIPAHDFYLHDLERQMLASYSVFP